MTIRMIKAENLSFGYREKNILQQVNTDFQPCLVTGVIGPNGVGKSTLIKCLARILTPESGTVVIKGRDIFRMKSRDLAKLEAYVPQSGSMVFPLTVMEYVTLGRKPYVEWSLSREDHKIIADIMEYLRITSMQDKYMDEISGGERQKVMLARALVQQPDILILDEPTSALDIRHQLEVMALLRKIAAEKRCAVIVVMHDLMLVARYCDRVVLMKDGKVFAHGLPEMTITEKNIREVYGITSRILQTEVGLVVLPLESIETTIKE